ncbi:MAG TPA: hypothetical protein VHY84_14540 [Bryobacteraceae bacterium]|nr:hypothetical protein [Bryobacteraceae bacterium]
MDVLVQIKQTSLELEQCESLGWTKLSPWSYEHYCGARVSKRGQSWNAANPTGFVSGPHTTAKDAMSYVEKHDPDFWSYGTPTLSGYYSGLWFRTGHNPANENDIAFVCYWHEKDDFPFFLYLTFERHVFPRARCKRCLQFMTKITARELHNL